LKHPAAAPPGAPRRAAATLAAAAMALGACAAPPGAPAAGGPLAGLYTYFADAGRFTPCGAAASLPVSMEAGNAALERAYLDALRRQGLAPGTPLFVEVEGEVAERPAMEGPPRAHLVPRAVVGVFPREACGPANGTSPLRGTTWRLVRLGGAAVEPATAAREPQLRFDADAPRVAGSTGCNRFAGGFTLEGERLAFGALAATKMACVAGMAEEAAFLAALQRTARQRAGPHHLELLDERGAVLARFQAAAVR
jgi:heat shock protein HslJ